MYVVIVGGGEVGRYVAEIVVAEGHDVAVVELDEELAGRLDASLDALVVHGSGVDPTDLQRAGIGSADLLLAVTATDEVNLIACMTASRYGSDRLRAIARVRQPYRVSGAPALRAEDLGLEALVSPEAAIAKGMGDALRYPGRGEMRELAGGKLVLVGMELGADSPLVHETLAELRSEAFGDFLVVAVRGRDGTRIPMGTDRLAVGDRVFIVTRPESRAELAILSGHPWHAVQRILIIGLGDSGPALARELAGAGLAVTIVEQDAGRAEVAARLVPSALVRHADGSDPELLRDAVQEGRFDAVVVLLGEPEAAVLIGIFAKSLGVPKVIVRCDRPGYSRLANQLGVDAVVSPKRAMADALLAHLRGSMVEAAVMLGEHELELLQLEVPARPLRADVVEKPLRSLSLPPGSLFVAVIRGGETLIGSGDTVLRPGDEVLVVCRPEALPKVEKLLS